MLRGKFGQIGKDFRDGHITMDAFEQVRRIESRPGNMLEPMSKVTFCEFGEGFNMRFRLYTDVREQLQETSTAAGWLSMPV